MVTIQIVDDHVISRWGLQRALEMQPHLRVTGLFGAVGEMKRGWRRRSVPDVVVLDLYLADDLPCVDGMADIAKRTAVLVVSASRRNGDEALCRAAGARGFVHKGADPETLGAAVRSVHAGGEYFRSDDDCEATPPVLSDLSPRERQVLAYIAGGYTHEQAARRLGVSRHTVDTYLKRLRAKIGDGNKAYLTRIAMQAHVPIDVT